MDNKTGVKKRKGKKSITKEVLLHELNDTIKTAKEYMITQNSEGHKELCEKKFAVYFKAIELAAKLLDDDSTNKSGEPIRVVLEGEINDYAK